MTTPSWADADDDTFDITHVDISSTHFISADIFSDKFNNLGQNISSQARRQSLIPWTTVDYSKKDKEFVFDKFKFSRDTTIIWSYHNIIFSNISTII